jgi:hypothetical protein
MFSKPVHWSIRKIFLSRMSNALNASAAGANFYMKDIGEEMGEI